jgi:hypothetical protein
MPRPPSIDLSTPAQDDGLVLGPRLQRWAPATGILFVVLIFTGFFGPMAPKVHDSDATIVGSFTHHRTGWLVKL